MNKWADQAKTFRDKLGTLIILHVKGSIPRLSLFLAAADNVAKEIYSGVQPRDAYMYYYEPSRETVKIAKALNLNLKVGKKGDWA